ncbi:glutamate--tRNA ligase, chloroplastic/mitochondrial-like isoform X2 [Arachis stenosperma]|uniref:glutamate--tRNA ligase, chloroplastic/mitochondrial-like isoform X2 n=1 Tax=Arachis stenosperma TaxID=217475 RepID=UPI0025AD37B3|nr:glutamate--tRNA ligase, chloroplastic/mitochondrial-like isoform X2 [Arachis stenosperma]
MILFSYRIFFCIIFFLCAWTEGEFLLSVASIIVMLKLEKMKEAAKLKQLPPVCTGKWANATNELTKGTPYTYRFRVRKGNLKMNDIILGEETRRR